MEIEISKEDIELLLKHARKEHPYEAVAVLLGIQKEGKFIVRVVRPMKNVLRSTTEFHVDPAELYNTYMEAEEQGLNVIGIFHSHPAPPYPSFLDMKYMKLNPIVWLIASSIDWNMKAFILKNGLKDVNMKIIEKI